MKPYLYFCFALSLFYPLKSFAQSPEIFFKSELVAVDEALYNRDWEGANKHLDKAGKYIKTSTQQHQLDLMAVKVYHARKEFLKAESALDRLLAQNLDSNFMEQVSYLKDLVFNIRDGANRERRFIQYEQTRTASLEKAKMERSISAFKAHIDNYPNHTQTNEARTMLGDLFLEKNTPLEYEDLNYLRQHYYPDSIFSAPNKVHSVTTSAAVALQDTFTALLRIIFANASMGSANALQGYANSKILQELRFEECTFLDNRIKKRLISPNIRFFTTHKCNLENIEELSFPQLQLLNISQNRLNQFPDLHPLAKATLKSVDLSSNQFLDLPSKLLQCTALQKLTIRNNVLTTLPKGIGQFQQLEYLDASFNVISSIPTSLYQIKSLKTLILYGIKTPFLPNGIDQLTQLENLGLGGNLEKLPTGIEQLTSLRSLGLVDMPYLLEFPSEILACKKLEELYVSNCPWKKIPEEITSLRRLKYLGLVAFNLSKIPDLVYKMPNLEDLNLRNNHIVQIEERIKNLSNLSSLDLSNSKLDNMSLIRVRCSLLSTDITYFDERLQKNIKSEKISKEKQAEIREKYQYFLEGDVQSAYELGRFFDDRGDAGIAYCFYRFGADNRMLQGKFKALINNLSIAEMYEKVENIEPAIASIDLNNWREISQDYVNTTAYAAYLDICMCDPRDEGGRGLKLNACARLLEIHNAVLNELNHLRPEYERQFNLADQKNRAASDRARNWSTLGTVLDQSGLLGGFTGVGTLVGTTGSLVNENIANGQAGKAATVTATLEDMANRMMAIQKNINKIENYRDEAKR